MKGPRVSTSGRGSDWTQPGLCVQLCLFRVCAHRGHMAQPSTPMTVSSTVCCFPILGAMVKPLEYAWHIGECKNNNKITSLT